MFSARLFPSGAAAVHGYSAQFFDLTPLSLFDRPVLELGRFAIDPHKGNSDVFRLAWGVVTQLVDQNMCRFCLDAVLLRACSRKHIPRPFAIFAVTTTLHWTVGARVFHGGYRLAQALDDHHNDRVTDLPPLLRAYLALGGKVSDHAAIDPDLGPHCSLLGWMWHKFHKKEHSVCGQSSPRIDAAAVSA